MYPARLSRERTKRTNLSQLAPTAGTCSVAIKKRHRFIFTGCKDSFPQQKTKVAFQLAQQKLWPSGSWKMPSSREEVKVNASICMVALMAKFTGTAARTGNTWPRQNHSPVTPLGTYIRTEIPGRSVWVSF